MCFVQTRSEIVVPIKRERVTIGVIDVKSDEADYFGPTDLQVFEGVAEEAQQLL